MAANNIVIASGAKYPRLGQYIITEPQETSILWALMNPEPNDRGCGVYIKGEQKGDPQTPEHLEFKYRNRSHIGPRPTPSGAAMKDYADAFNYSVVTGQREFFGKAVQTTAFLQSQLNRNMQKDAVEELREFVEMTPYDAQFAYSLSPVGADTGKATIASLTTPDLMWTALRTTELTNIGTTLDIDNIGAPGGTAAATDAEVRCAFLDKANNGIVRNPSGQWTTMNDNNVPTVDNLRGYLQYLRRQNYRVPTWKFGGKMYTGFINMVEEGFFYQLEQDPKFADIQNWIEPKGDENTIFAGVDKILKLHGMYFVKWQQYHSDFTNNTPLYSADYGSGGMAKYVGVTLTRASFMTSMYENPPATYYQADHVQWQFGIYAIIGSKILTDLRTSDADGTTTTTRNRVCHLLYSAPQGD